MSMNLINLLNVIKMVNASGMNDGIGVEFELMRV